MAVAPWQPGKLYLPGDLCRPATGGPQVPVPIPNADFEDGGAHWTVGVWVPRTEGAGGDAFTGTGSLEFPAGVFGTHVFEHEDYVPCEPGRRVTAWCMVQQGASGDGRVGANVDIWFYDAAHNRIDGYNGNNVNSGSGGAWKKSTVSAVAPAGTAFVRIAGHGTRAGDNKPLWIDSFAWDLTAPDPNDALIYKAVQPRAGYSGANEPAWPDTLGVQVIDNEVVWEAIGTSRVTWIARPLLKSGPTEPNWSTVIGGETVDNTIAWKATSQRIEDPKCPQSKIVEIAASKVFAADGDIIKYCATVNPLDWSTANDAGYIPWGLQTYGDNPAAALGLYRSNLVPFSAVAFQHWQVDEDPANNNLLDALPIGCIYHHSFAPVSNDLLFLSSEGVRSVGIAASSTNLAAGDVGMPVDVIVQAAMAATAASGKRPVAIYHPTAGQYLLAFSGWREDGQPGSTIFVYTMTKVGSVGAWSQYVFPFASIDGFTQLGRDIYIRAGDDVLRFDETVDKDFVGDPREAAFEGVIQWHWLMFGEPGADSVMFGFDHVGEGSPTIAFGYNQKNKSAFTAPYPVPGDTVPEEVIPYDLTAPSISVRLVYSSTERWHFQALNLYFA